MNDILSIASRVAEYAMRTGPRTPVTEQEREDLLTLVDAARHLNGLLNAVPARTVQIKRPPG